jgi:hypothetical protein
MKLARPEVHAVPMPAACSLNGMYPRVDLTDSYAITLPPGTVHDLERLAHSIFDRPAPWMVALMKTRDFVVARLGLKTGRNLLDESGTGRPKRISLFRIYFQDADEILLGEDDRHLDFRLSILLQVSERAGGQTTLILSSVVHCHNRLGHVYLAVIAPFHRLISKAVLRRAACAGWPSEAPPHDDRSMATAL